MLCSRWAARRRSESTANSAPSRSSLNRRSTSSRRTRPRPSLNIMGDNLWQVEDLLRHGSCDASYGLSGPGRFRVNVLRTIFAQRDYSIVCRQLNSAIPTLEQLKFPDILVKEIPKEKPAILVTGATGSGKSTTPEAPSSTKSTAPSPSPTSSRWKTRSNMFARPGHVQPKKARTGHRF